jgi:hypothetical protein
MCVSSRQEQFGTFKSDTAPDTRADLPVVVLFLQPLELLPQDGVTISHLQAA